MTGRTRRAVRAPGRSGAKAPAPGKKRTRRDTGGDKCAVLDAEGVGLLLGVAKSTIYAMDGRDELPEPVVIGRVRRWVRIEILSWLAFGAPKRATWARLWPRVRKEVLRT